MIRCDVLWTILYYIHVLLTLSIPQSHLSSPLPICLYLSLCVSLGPCLCLSSCVCVCVCDTRMRARTYVPLVYPLASHCTRD